jgi:hypothetical protein
LLDRRYGNDYILSFHIDYVRLTLSHYEVVMKTIMSYSVILVIALLCASCSTKPEEKSLMSVLSFIGDVKKSVNGSEQPLKSGEIVVAGDTIITGHKSSADISVGQNGVVRINENTSIKVDQLAKGDSLNTELNISKGRAFIVLSKLSKDEQCTVKTPTAVAAVRGTSFRISAEGDTSRIDVVSGKVLVSPVKEGEVVKGAEVVLEKNNTVTLDTAAVASIVDDKKPIKVESISNDEMKMIMEETKEISTAPNADQSLKNEIQENLVQPDNSAEKLEAEKKESEKKAAADEKRKQEEKKRLEAEKMKKENAKKNEEARIAAAEKAAAEKAAAEKAEKEKAEKIKKEKQEQKEVRVKNIPTI